MKNNGKLIVLEGACDGIGKTTQYQKLYDRLVDEGYMVVKHHFPSYNTNHGNGVEKYLHGDFGDIEDLSLYFINSLYAHDRAVTWYSKLKKDYEDGKIILLDRYTTSSLIYQTANIKDVSERINAIDYLADFEYNKIGIKAPDVVIFLTMPFELNTLMRTQRKANDGIENDIHESNLEFMKRVYDNSNLVAEHFGFEFIKCNDGNNLMSIDDIHEDIYKRVKKILK